MKKKMMTVLTLMTILAAMAMLPRCGSGVGEGFEANANGVKF